ncbi:IclR family transcriptional regulator [Pseudolysinimonas sp.]
MANSRSGDSVIDRIVRVLATFDRERRVLSATEIARRAGLPTSTAHRLVGDLAAAGLLERDDDGAYRVGLRLWELATRGSRALGLREAAIPAMERVQARVRQHTQLAVLDDGETLFVERLSHPDGVGNRAQVAGRLPLHASSAGLVLLAHARASVVEAVLAGALPALAAGTITDPAALRRKLAEVRRVGYASAPGSIEAVSTGIAVPVREGRTVVAALGVVLPFDAGDPRPVAALLAAEAEEIAAALALQRSRSMG